MGGAGSAVLEALQAAGLLKPVLMLGLKDQFTSHGDPAKLMAMEGLDAAGIESSVLARYKTLLPSQLDTSKQSDSQGGLKLVN